MMNLFKNSLRLVIATGSVLGFLGGWVLLAHAGKPAPINPPTEIAAPLPTIPALPAIGGSPTGLQPLPPMPQFSALPRLRSRGS